MSYQPPSQPGGDAPPPDQGQGGSSSGGSSSGGDYSSGQGSYTQPMGGQGSSAGGGGDYTPPPSGGYTPPPSGGGGYSPPPGGGYSPPPGGGGGYGAPPPSGGGGYSPPPGGGYNPPPGGGYNPPPGGGYGAPPPPQGGPGGYNVNMSSLNRNVAIGNTSLNPADLLQSYINAVTKPNPNTYAAEMGNASWVKTLVGVAVVAVISFLINLIFAGAAASSFNSVISQLQTQGQGQSAQALENMRGLVGGGGVAGAFGSLIFTFVFFFLGALVLYGMAKILGGQGGDFMTHSYLLSLSYTPLRVVSTVLAIIPVVGGCVSFLLYLYQLYSAGLSMQASQRMTAGRAQLAAFIPLIALIVLGCGCLLLASAAIISALNGTSNP